jgi:hypothetical protein
MGKFQNTRKVQKRNSWIVSNVDDIGKTNVIGKLKLGTWNVRGLMGKQQELMQELKKKQIGIEQKPKKKKKGTQDWEDYILIILIYLGVPAEQRASSGVAILFKQMWINRIVSYSWILDRIISLKCKTGRSLMNIIGVYAPTEGNKTDTHKFYKELQETVNITGKSDYTIIAGDLNARVGKVPITEILGTNGEESRNNNGKDLIGFCFFSKLCITNTYFKHKDNHMYT